MKLLKSILCGALILVSTAAFADDAAFDKANVNATTDNNQTQLSSNAVNANNASQMTQPDRSYIHGADRPHC